MMANYTMEINQLMNNPVIGGVFTFPYNFYSDNEQDKKEFEQLFIQHFYFREIGFETPYHFKLKLQATLNLKMPYYRQLAQTEWNKVRSVEQMMTSKNLKETTTHEQSIKGNSTVDNHSTGSINQSSEGTTSGTSNDLTKQSSLSDGVSSVSLEQGYLTGTAQSNGENQQTSTTAGTQSQTSTDQSNANNEQTLSETTTFHSSGDIGIQTPAYAITEWRKVILNLNEMLIKDCEDLFMKLY